MVLAVRPIGNASGGGGAFIGESIAAIHMVGLQAFINVGEGQGFIFEAMSAKIIRHVLFEGGALGDTDGGAIQIRHALDAGVLAHQKGLAGVEIDTGVIETQRDIAGKGPGGAIREHIHAAGLQQGKRRVRRHRHIFNAEFPEDGGSEHFAMINVHARALTLVIDAAEPGAGFHYAATQETAFAHCLQRLGVRKKRHE